MRFNTKLFFNENLPVIELVALPLLICPPPIPIAEPPPIAEADTPDPPVDCVLYLMKYT